MSRKSPKASSSRKLSYAERERLRKRQAFQDGKWPANRPKGRPTKALVDLGDWNAPGKPAIIKTIGWGDTPGEDVKVYPPGASAIIKEATERTLGRRAADAENAKLCAENPAAKPSNPKDALGILKIPYSTISQPVIAEVGVAMLEGALKYGRHNYRAIGVRASVYFDAVVARHLAAWWEGEDIDPDSDLHHITKAIAGLCVIRDAMIQGKFIDDRPPKSPAGWQAALNDKVKALLAKYPNPVPPYLEGDERMRPQPSAGDLAYAKLCQQAIEDPESVKVK